MNNDETLRSIRQIVEKHFNKPEEKFIPGKTKILTMVPPFSTDEVMEAIDSLLSTRLTMGEKVKTFEKQFSSYIGSKWGVMTNSGSSANLLALSVLSNPTFQKCMKNGDEVITPAFTWATTIYPILNVGLQPVLVDSDPETFNINVDVIEKAITNKTKAIMVPHLVGNPADIKRILEIAKKNNLFVIEDACEAHGAEVDGKRVGSFGDVGTFSFFFSHHITTIEGGMVVTSNDIIKEFLRSMRAFGWIRDMDTKEELTKKYPDIDNRVLFVNMGFNIRPTELQAAFGIHQLKKIEKLIDLKKKNADYWNERFSKYSDWMILPTERKGTKHSWFVYPLVVKPEAPFKCKELMNFLEIKGIETRLVAAGNMAEQPVFSKTSCRISGSLKGAEILMRGSFFFGDHMGIKEAEREYIADCFDEFMGRYKK